MKENYQAMCDDILKSLASENCSQAHEAAAASGIAGKPQKPRLLLHACCAPCSSYTLEYLLKYFDITIFYYNPNIHPAQEYARRLQELKNFLPRFLADKNAMAGGTARADLQEAAYEPEEFFGAVQAERDNLQDEPERGERCRRCYQLRMEKAYDYAAKNGFDWFTTTLSISPHKDAVMINEIGRALAANGMQAKDCGRQSLSATDNRLQGQNAPKFLFSDFKKKNGYKRSLELSKEYGFYRQDYCGCIYSMENRK